MGSVSPASPEGDLFTRFRRLEVEKARLMGETAIASATVVGLRALVAALAAEVTRLDPNSPLVRPDGSYEDGGPRIAADAAFEAAFDRAIGRIGLPGLPHEYRSRKAA